VATTPTPEKPVRSYPDHQQNGAALTTRKRGTETPSQRPAKSITIPMRIARIETTLMTPDEFDAACKALGLLLHQYWQRQHDLAG
jgi:hypothetical protein